MGQPLWTLTKAHCVLLEHYYSVDFPWWFDKKKMCHLNCQWKLVKWQQMKLHFLIWQKSCLCLTSLNNQIFKSFWKPNPWMNLLEFFSIMSVFTLIFCSLSPFYREWPQSATILTSFDLSFVTKSKSLIFEVKQAIHGGKDLIYKK